MMSSQDEILELSDISSSHSISIAKPSPRFPHLRAETVSNATSLSEEITFAKSDAHSFRDKLKRRFNSLKKQAEKSASAGDFRGVSQRISLLGSSIKVLQRENEGVESEVGSRRRGRGDDFEEYVFFCESGNQPQETQKEAEEDEEWDDSTVFKYKLPEQLNYVVNLHEDELFFQPKRISKVEFTNEEVNLGAIGEDGLYVLNKPRISKQDLLLLQHRLTTDEDIKWFDRDGTLNTLELPFANFSLRPSTENLQLTEYCPPAVKQFAPCEEVIIHQQNAILDLQILSLTFKHHPLFSVEHVLQQKLVDYYDVYQKMITQNKLQRFTSRLDALRNAKERLEKQAGDANLTEIEEEITKLRDRLLEDGKCERDALKGLLQTWKAIKRLRDGNGYSSTPIKLTIRKETADYSQDKAVLERQIQETVSEIINERSKEFERKMKTYKEELHVWKASNNEDVEKPKKPQKHFNEIEVKMEVLSKFEESFRSPGEPKLHFEISYDNEITTDIQDGKEKLRRTCVNTTKVWLKIFCNELEVCKTKHVSLSDRFTCVFEENVSIQLNTPKANIVVEIMEQPGALLKRKCGEVSLQVPLENEKNQLREQYFLKEEMIHYNKHEGVGSGVAFSEIFPDLNLPDYALNTSGFVLSNSGWDFDGKPLKCLQESNFGGFDEIFDENGMIDIAKLAVWTENKHLDPEDPRNAVLYDYIKTFAESAASFSESGKKYFRLNPLQRSLTFCDFAEVERNIRLIVLQHRNNNVPEFSGMVVPIRLKEIPFNVLQSYLQRLNDLKQDFNSFSEDDLEVKRSKGKKFLKQVFMNIFQQCRNAEDNLCFEDVVDEKYLAHFDLLVQTFIRKLVSFFSFRPKIERNFQKPATTSKKQIESEEKEKGNEAVKIVVHLQSGLNIPCRSGNDDVKPFITIEYGGVEVVSSTAEGPNCSWNEKLILPVETTHTDYLNPDSLNGSVIIRLFDNVSNETTNSAIFLASLDIPISAICSSQMDGFFCAKVPHLITDYQRYHEKVLSGSAASISLQQTSAQETYILMKIFSTPALPKLNPSMEEWPCNEPPYLKGHILRWNSWYNASYPSKKFSALVLDLNGRSSCITRYIRPLEPPQLNPEGFDVTPEQCARYVTMIPFTECNKFYENVCLTTDQLLKLMIGSVLDHAVALTCYLLSLNVEAFLLLGFGIANGNTAYVLFREYIKEVPLPVHYIFDVISGAKYSLVDVYCPLQRVFCVVNEHNIWANLQRTDKISNVRFDLTRRLDWSSLFNNKTQAPSNTVQTKLNYFYENHVQELELRIDKKIKRKVMKFRKLQRTVWNHSVAKAYKNIMRKLEFNNLHGKSSKEAHLEVNRALGNVQIKGYILNSAYTKVSTMVKELLKRTQHLIETESVDFATVTYVHPYPASVYSTWTLLVSVTQ